jgi:hypothetical protein
MNESFPGWIISRITTNNTGPLPVAAGGSLYASAADPNDIVVGLGKAAAQDQRTDPPPRSLWTRALRAARELGCALRTSNVIDGGCMRTRVTLETRRGDVSEIVWPVEGEEFPQAWERVLRSMGLLD